MAGVVDVECGAGVRRDPGVLWLDTDDRTAGVCRPRPGVRELADLK